jgi:penicillin amidase
MMEAARPAGCREIRFASVCRLLEDRMFRRGWFLLLSLGVAVLLVIVLTLAHLRARVAASRLPDRGRSIQTIEGCPAVVEILFDGRGAPHVYSGSDSALWFAQGYLHARDRFFQMDLTRRRANGRLAELFGSRALEGDRKMRILRLAASARRQSALLTGYERRALEMYAAGVNAALRQYGSWIAPEVWLLGVAPEPWTVEDSLVGGVLMQLDKSGAMGEELQRSVELSHLGRDRAVDIWGWTPAEARAWIPPGEPVMQPQRDHEPITPPVGDLGSDAWAIAPQRSASGLPLLAVEPHLGVQLPAGLYPIHLKGPGLEVAGASIPGMPGVFIGHTQEVAWGLTFSMMDDQDLFVLTLDDAGDRELIDGRWRPLRTVTENIVVRWQPEPVLVKVRLSVHGPVVREQHGDSLALAWSGLSGPSLLPAVLGMNRALSVAAVAESWESVVGPSMNLLAADTGGNILHQVVGRVPERGRGAGRLPAPGSDSRWAWKGFVPMSANPRRVDPSEGFLASANHDLFAEGDYPSSQSFPGEFASPWRVRRIRSALAMNDRWTVAGCLELQGDVISSQAIAVLKLLRPDFEKHGGAVARELMLWDGKMAVDSSAATRFSQFILELEDAVGGDESERVSLARNPLGREQIIRLLAGGLDESWWDDVSRPGRQTRNDILGGVLDRLDHATDARPWGEVHQVLFSHPLAWLPGLGPALAATWSRGPFPVGGDNETINAETWSRRQPYSVTAAPAMRFVTEVGNWDATVLGLPTGQSGRPWSGFYSDQIGSWLHAEASPFPFSRKTVEAAAVARLQLIPRYVRVSGSAVRQ